MRSIIKVKSLAISEEKQNKIYALALKKEFQHQPKNPRKGDTSPRARGQPHIEKIATELGISHATVRRYLYHLHQQYREKGDIYDVRWQDKKSDPTKHKKHIESMRKWRQKRKTGSKDG